MAGLLNHQVDVRQLPKGGQRFKLRASAKECATLQDRLKVRSVDAVEAEFVVQSLGRRAGLRLTGTVTADIIQACVATLEDVPAQISEEMAVRFVEESYAADNTTADLDPEEDDVEHFSGGFVDVSEVVVQYIALAIDPYPRAEKGEETAEIVYSSGSGGAEEEEEKPHPFAELKKLKDKT